MVSDKEKKGVFRQIPEKRIKGGFQTVGERKKALLREIPEKRRSE